MAVAQIGLERRLSSSSCTTGRSIWWRKGIFSTRNGLIYLNLIRGSQRFITEFLSDLFYQTAEMGGLGWGGEEMALLF